MKSILNFIVEAPLRGYGHVRRIVDSEIPKTKLLSKTEHQEASGKSQEKINLEHHGGGRATRAHDTSEELIDSPIARFTLFPRLMNRSRGLFLVSCLELSSQFLLIFSNSL